MELGLIEHQWQLTEEGLGRFHITHHWRRITISHEGRAGETLKFSLFLQKQEVITMLIRSISRRITYPSMRVSIATLTPLSHRNLGIKILALMLGKWRGQGAQHTRSGVLNLIHNPVWQLRSEHPTINRPRNICRHPPWSTSMISKVTKQWRAIDPRTEHRSTLHSRNLKTALK